MVTHQFPFVANERWKGIEVELAAPHGLGSPDTCSGGKRKVELIDPSLASYVSNGEHLRDPLMLLNPHLEHSLYSSIQTLLTLSFCSCQTTSI